MLMLTRISHLLLVLSGYLVPLLRSRLYLSSTYILIGLRMIEPAASKRNKLSRSKQTVSTNSISIRINVHLQRTLELSCQNLVRKAG